MQKIHPLRRYRYDAGITQAQLAKKLKVTSAQISKWENGVFLIPPVRARKISRILGIPAHDLRPDVFEKVAA